MTWQQSEEACRSAAGHLAALSSAAEEALVKSMVPASTTITLPVGLSDLRAETFFEWSNREPLVYTNWIPGRPVPAPWPADNIYDCVYIITDGAWGDYECIPFSWPFVCEIPMSCP
jgi:hypothetical protein